MPRLARALALCLLAVASPLCAQDKGSADAPPVTVVPVEETDLTLTVTAPGSLMAREQAEVYAKVSGPEITEILVDVGDHVEKGQVLVRLDDTALRAQLGQAQANLASAEAGISQAQSQLTSAEATQKQAAQALERTRALNTRGDAAQSALDQATATAQSADASVGAAQAALAAAQAQKAQVQSALDLAQLNLGWAEIAAPVSGTVLSRTARIGALSAPGGQPLFTLATGGDIEVEAEVIETDLPSVHDGDETEVYIPGLGTLKGHVRLISPVVDPVTRLGLVRIAVDDNTPLHTGLFARATIVTDRRVALTVPASAVLSDADGQYVQRVADGVVQRVRVTAGILLNGRREIVDGLSAGDTVIERAGSFFRQGDKVTPVTSSADPAATPPLATDAAQADTTQSDTGSGGKP